MSCLPHPKTPNPSLFRHSSRETITFSSSSPSSSSLLLLVPPFSSFFLLPLLVLFRRSRRFRHGVSARGVSQKSPAGVLLPVCILDVSDDPEESKRCGFAYGVSQKCVRVPWRQNAPSRMRLRPFSRHSLGETHISVPGQVHGNLAENCARMPRS